MNRRVFVLLVGLVLSITACGTAAGNSSAEICAAAPQELTITMHPVSSGPPTSWQVTDPTKIKAVVTAGCGLPLLADSQDVMCTDEMGPTFELRFDKPATTVTLEHYGCRFVTGLGEKRWRSGPLWDAMTAAVGKCSGFPGTGC